MSSRPSNSDPPLAASCLGGWVLSCCGLAIALALAVPSRGAGFAGRSFQDTVHGLGMGPAAEATTCARTFDPRLADRCAEEIGSLPGGAVLCRLHPLSVLTIPERTRVSSGRERARIP